MAITNAEAKKGGTTSPEDLFLGLYRRAIFDNAGITYSGEMWGFRSYVGTRDQFGSGDRTLHDAVISDLVAFGRVPQRWRNDMQRLIAAYSAGRSTPLPFLYVGCITIKFREQDRPEMIAVTENYNPRNAFRNKGIFPFNSMERAAPGLGYATEFRAVSSLRGHVTHISTSQDPSQARESQLEKAGLPTRQAVPIDEWLSGLRRGYERSARKAMARA